jgi:hypothetical protein
MTPERFRECMDVLDMSDHRLSEKLDVPVRLVRRWRGGSRRVPPSMAAWIESFVAWTEANPVPEKRVPADVMLDQ